MKQCRGCKGGKLLWTLFFIISSFNVNASPPRFISALFGNIAKDTNTNNQDAGNQNQWSSFLTVDPAKIISLLIHRGGLVLPRDIQDELLAAANVCAVDEAQLNVLDRRLLFSNFTVAIPGSPKALRVGRLCMTWDSYLKPCVDIELDDVDILVEFINLILTKTNWNELHAAGFPPETVMTMSEEPSTSSGANTFFRIGSIDLSGSVKAQLRSRPLNKQIAPILVFDLDSLDDLNTQIQKCSDANLVETGRRGCTTNELYELIQAFVADRVRKSIESTAHDLAINPFQKEDTATVRDSKRIISGATSTILNYAVDATRVKGKDIQDAMTNRLDNSGFEAANAKVEQVRLLSEQVANRWGLPKTLRYLKSSFVTASETALSMIEEAKLTDANAAKIVAQVAQQQPPEGKLFPESP